MFFGLERQFARWARKCGDGEQIAQLLLAQVVEQTARHQNEPGAASDHEVIEMVAAGFSQISVISNIEFKIKTKIETASYWRLLMKRTSASICGSVSTPA